jgi:hypothetical protein
LYLAFSEDQSFPLCIAQFGSEKELCGVHGLLHDLHAALPDIVPRSLACTRWRKDLWVHVQSGLPGVPWFSLSRRIRTLDGWLDLRRRALATLRQFQAAVRIDSTWNSTISPANELLQQLEICRRNGHVLSTCVVGRATECAGQLEALGCCPFPWQHGDYCFNNLLVAPDRLGLIDFEEFGSTAVPLQDELSLAFSADGYMRGLPGSPPLRAQITTCVEACDSTPTSAPSLEGLLFHHLLWRLNQCAARPRRSAMADALERHLCSLAADPGGYLELR